ncbi:MAG: oligosaccharide flippase family protein [Endomicrobia bacterium]|nr:oligosaccharide flippase family protein [Endomicrobiia bacterium]
MKIIENIGYSTFQTIISFFLSFLIQITVARSLKPANMGHYSFFLWLITFSSTVILLGLPLTLTKYISQFYPQEKDKIIRLIRYFLKYTVISFIVGSLVIFVLVNNKLPIGISVVIIGLGMYIFNNILSSIISGLQNFKVLMLSSTLSQAIQLFLVFFILSKFPNINLMITIYLVTLIISIVINLFGEYRWKNLLMPETDVCEDKNLEKTEIKNIIDYYKFVSVILFLDFIIWQNSEVFFLKLYSPVEEIALYSIGFSLAYLPSKIIGSPFGRVLIPFMSSLYGRNEDVRLRETYFNFVKLFSLLLIPTYIFLIFYSDSIIEVLYGSKYIKASIVLRIISFSALIGGIASVGSSYVHAVERPDIIVKINFFVAFINILLNILLIPKFHSIGASFGNTISQVIGCFLGTGYLIYRFGLKFPFVSVLKYLIVSVIGCYFINFVKLYKILISIPYIILVFIFYMIFYLLIFISEWKVWMFHLIKMKDKK